MRAVQCSSSSWEISYSRTIVDPPPLFSYNQSLVLLLIKTQNSITKQFACSYYVYTRHSARTAILQSFGNQMTRRVSSECRNCTENERIRRCNAALQRMSGE